MTHPPWQAVLTWESLMSLGFLILLQPDQVETTFKEPSYFVPLIVGSLALGAVVWLIAAVMGFARARAFGASARWFSFAAVCVRLYHLEFLLLGFVLCLSMPRGRAGFVQTNGLRFVIDGKPFRFVGANVAAMYRDDDRAHMPETLRQAAQIGIKVVRVWASGEGGPRDVKPIADLDDWPRTHAFRYTPNEWNEAEFVFLDQVLAEAARNGLRVQLCLANWWRDTGGVTQYLRWAGISGADDDKYPFGINNEKAMLFYSNEDR